MAQLTEKKRDKLKDSQYAYVTDEGERKLPVNDESHVRNAVSRFNQTEFESAEDKRRAARKVLAAADKKDVDVSDDSNVAKAAKRKSS